MGGTTPLTSIATDAGGVTAIDATAITTTGAQVYRDAVTLGGTNTTLTSTGGAAITLAGAVDGASALEVDTAGTTTFGGAVGSSTPLISVTTDADGGTAINGSGIKTSGAQTLQRHRHPGRPGHHVDLGAGGADVTFVGTVNGAVEPGREHVGRDDLR